MEFWLYGCTVEVNGLYVAVAGEGVTLHRLVDFWETSHGSVFPRSCDHTEE
jgi:hypothetical protein